MSDYRECRNRDNCGGWLENHAQIESGLCENCLQERDDLVRDDELATLRAQLAAAEARADETRRLYNELLHQVGMKYPGETRHETAIRYLRLAEIHVCGPAVAGLHGEVKP